MPRILARRHKLKIIGDGENIVGLTYVENAAFAHLLACDALQFGSPNAGKAYFITDLQPVKVWAWINEVFRCLGYPPITRKIPAGLVYVVGAVLEDIWKFLGIEKEPFMTRFVAKSLSTHQYYDLSAAIEDFGYYEKENPKEGFEKMLGYFREKPPK